MDVAILRAEANGGSRSRKGLVRIFGPAFLLLVAGAFGADAQGIVRGSVCDPLGAVVKDARVTLERGDTTVGETKTDGQGIFSFPNISAGRYRVRVKAAGFSNYTGVESFVGSSGIATLDVLLQVSDLKQEVVVSATGSEVSISQVGASVSLIDTQEIQAENKLDVLENLRQIAGAQIVQTGQRDHIAVHPWRRIVV